MKNGLQRLSLFCLVVLLAAASLSVQAKLPPRLIGREWVYLDYDDPATGRRVHDARRGTAEFLDTAYGKVGARFIIQAISTKTLFEVDLLEVNKHPPLDCPSTGCTITFQFDENPPVDVPVTVLPGAYSAVNIVHPEGIIESLKHADETKVTLRIKGDAERTFTIHTADFEWPREDK